MWGVSHFVGERAVPFWGYFVSPRLNFTADGRNMKAALQQQIRNDAALQVSRRYLRMLQLFRANNYIL